MPRIHRATPSKPLPEGTLTFLFSDIEGSTKLWEQQREAMRIALARHDALMRQCITQHGGHVIKTTGDGFYAAFASASDALEAALAAQKALHAEPWSEAIRIRVRMALHTGAAELRDGDYYGPVLNRAARLAALGHGGQTLLSEVTHSLCRDLAPDDVTFKPLGQHSLKGLARSEAVFELCHPALPQAFPSLRAARTQNLPRPLTSFIGHDEDLAEYAGLLEQTRLLTLTGIGGCGKTRLAIKLAETVLPSFPDGVCFVDFAPVAGPERVALTVATALGVREEADKPIEETLNRHLADQRSLLVLDNCEHLLGACAALAERLLMAAPGLRVLVTSREGLGIAGERVVPVRSLSLPSATEQDERILLASDAVRLFVDRARLVAPEFKLGPGNAGAVVEICRRLDGIPLALELAAARLQLLSVEQIRAKLVDRFRLLTGSARAMSRHQTLLATLQWSYEHLTPDEQQWLQRLAVFAGGWTLDAAAAIADEGSDEIETLEQLGRLVDKSLVVVEREAPEEPRYRMLETVRQYAQDRLNDSGESDAVRERHLAYYLALAQRAHPSFFTKDASRWEHRIDVELPNLLAAHAWCDRAKDGASLGLELTANLRLYWINRGLFTLGQQIYDETFAREGVDQRSMQRARTLFALGQHLFFRGWSTHALAPLEEALAIAREHGDDECTVYCLSKLGNSFSANGEFARALACAEEQQLVAERIGSPRFIGTALLDKGEVLRRQGDFDAAAAAFEKALALESKDKDNLQSRNTTLNSIAHVSLVRGALGRAQETLAEALRVSRELGARYRAVQTLDVASCLAAARGDWQRAARLQCPAKETQGNMSGFWNPMDDEVLAELRAMPRVKLGAEAYAAAYEGGRGLTLDAALDEALAWLEESASNAPAPKSVPRPRRSSVP